MSETSSENAVTTPHHNDVLLGRGPAVNNWPGNRHLRSLILRQMENFAAARRKHKREIAMNIIREIHDAQPPGRFLVAYSSSEATKESPPDASQDVPTSLRDKTWKCVGPERALVKVMHGLREKGARSESGGDRPTENELRQEPPTEREQSDHQDGTGNVDEELETFLCAGGTGDFDTELGTFIDAFSAQLDEDKMEMGELSMLEWIDRSKRKWGKSFQATPEYIRAALSIALKLTEFLSEAERDSGDAIPLASIVSPNVLLRTKVVDVLEGSELRANVADLLEGSEEIEFAWIMSCVGDDPETGGILPRLAALGALLCELFSGGAVTIGGEHVLGPDATSNASSLNSVKLNDVSNGLDQPKKRLPRRRASEAISECLHKIELMGIPRSVCALLNNLLACSGGDFRDDAAFASYDGVRVDLQLMRTDPARFLDDIPTNPLPSLKICDKLYGREKELNIVEASYRQLREGECDGILIAGGAGVGKSALARHVKELTLRAGGYFVGTKYEQNDHVMPLSAIGGVFNTLCNLFARDATPSQLISVGEALGLTLGGHTITAPALPSLAALVPANSRMDSSGGCVDSGLRLRFLFSQLLQAISSQSRSISLFFDDMQWADPSSLALIASLISDMKGSRSVFLICCYRDDDVGSIHNWVDSIATTSLMRVKLESMSETGVNNLVSDTLRISPRITRPLSSVLHHKTKGNPLFLRQLIESLKNQGHIYFKLNEARWVWDLNEIMDMELSEGVVLMLINEMRRLPLDVQTSLKVASCLGCVKYSVLDILSEEWDLDLQRLSVKGFMYNDRTASSFRWVHDKVEQSAIELMPEQERRELHMRLGLAISSHIMDDDDPGSNKLLHDELLFTAVNQINCGGLGALSDPTKRVEIALLNLNAGKRAVLFSDYNAALKLFECGVSFLPTGSWDDHYDLSVALFDAAAEAAGITNSRTKVDFYSNQLIAHAKCFDDTLNCLHSLAKAKRQANQHKESMDSFCAIIQQCGEELPLPMGNEALKIKTRAMNQILQNSSDESILRIRETGNKKVVILLKIYTELANICTFVQPSLIGAVSLRMVDITMKSGLTSMCSCAFAFYAATLVNMGNEYVGEACRLANIALKLLEKGRGSHKSRVICIAYFCVLWASNPLQCVAKAHQDGHRAGVQSGDILYSVLNELVTYIDNYVAGQNLTILRKHLKDYYLKLVKEKIPVVSNPALIYHVQAVVLQDGKSRLQDDSVDGLPGLRKITDGIEEVVKNGGRLDTTVSLIIGNFHVQRALLFREFDDISFSNNNLSDVIFEEKHQLRPNLLMGIFFEGLVSFQLARQTTNETKGKWIAKGSSALVTMQCWTNHCRWNFENKMLLLEAEKMCTLGRFEEAAELYPRSIRSAHDHRFVHEVAIASESAGDFFYERHNLPQSVALYKHSIKCYQEWGAFAVARRVENSLQRKIKDPGIAQFGSVDDSLAFIFASQQASSRKRPVKNGLIGENSHPSQENTLHDM